MDEKSDVANKSQLLTCIHYVYNNGNVLEKFLKFTDISSDNTAGALFHFVDKDINECGLSDKIIGQNCDGAPVMQGGIGVLQALVK